MRISQKVQEITAQKRMGLMTHIVIGYPTMKESHAILDCMVESGVDFIELQIPFSDPMADGPTIMSANNTSLKNGTTVSQCMDFMRRVSGMYETPFLFMSYYNIIFAYGVEKFCKDVKSSGAQGVIIPDIPIDEEEAEGFYAAAKKHHINVIAVLAPENEKVRLQKLTERAEGFVYLPSRKGITGTQERVKNHLVHEIQKVKEVVDLPIAVGFGISQKEHVTQLKKDDADIAVIGSAIIDRYNAKGVCGVDQFLKEIFDEITSW